MTISTAHNCRKILFAGPTFASMPDRSLPGRLGFEVLAPAKRGDIRSLSQEPPGLVVLADGAFDQSLAVGHAELRGALEQGWKVWGLSSMGAIRAFEMRTLGMRGFGRVYEHFLGEFDFQDDEVALLHSSEAPYTAYSEPLVHIRHCLAAMKMRMLITSDHAQTVVDELKGQWFGDRSLIAFVEAVARIAGTDSAGAARALVHRFDTFRIKTTDLSEFFERSVWLDSSYEATPTPCPFSRA